MRVSLLEQTHRDDSGTCASQGIPDHFMFHARNNRIKTLSVTPPSILLVVSVIAIQMHRRIGNAVPWPVSVAIGREFLGTLYKHPWKRYLPGNDVHGQC